MSNTCGENGTKLVQSQPTSPCDVFMRDTCSNAPQLSFVKFFVLVGDRRESQRARPRFGPKALTITLVHGLPLALLTVPWNGPQEQCKPPRNRRLTVSQQCSLCVKIVKAGPFLHWPCLSFKPQLWANKAGLKFSMMVAQGWIAWDSVCVTEHTEFGLFVSCRWRFND